MLTLFSEEKANMKSKKLTLSEKKTEAYKAYLGSVVIFAFLCYLVRAGVQHDITVQDGASLTCAV